MPHTSTFRLLENLTMCRVLKYRKLSKCSENVKRYSTNVAAQEAAIDYESAKPYEDIPGPTALPIIGTMHHFGPRGKYKGLDMYDFFEKLQEEYGKIVKVKGALGKVDVVHCYDCEEMEKVYRTEGVWPYRVGFDTGEHYKSKVRPDIFKSVNGLLHSQGEQWHDVRSKVNQPMMQPKIVKQYVERIEEITNEFLERLPKICDKNGKAPENFTVEMNLWSMESIARIALDTRLGCLSSDLTYDADALRLMDAIRTIFNLVYKLDILPSPWKLISTPNYRKIIKAYDTLTEICTKHISTAKERLKASPKSDSDPELSVLEKLLKVDPLVANSMAIDMLFAGVDTTASTVITVLYHLAKNPDKQRKLVKEIKEIFPKGARLNAEGLDKMSFLKACIKETNRIRPIAINVFRSAGTDLVLGGYRIPKGTNVSLQHHLAAKCDEQFPEHQSYIPERWLRANSESALSAKSAHKFAYMPFGFGPRMCVGRRFAELEIEIFLTRLLSQYRVEWLDGPDMKFEMLLTSAPMGPMNFIITPTY